MDNNLNKFEGVMDKDKYYLARHYRVIGRGSSRIIYALDRNTVLKVPISLRGRYQSRVENKLFTSASVDLTEYLCPILAFKNDRLVMKRAETFNYRWYPRNATIFDIMPWEEKYDCKKALRKLIREYDLLQEDILRVSSWGMYQGKYVLVDYGCTNRIFDEFYQ